MVIDKLISVGGLCEGFAFAELLGKRVHGPVDNVAAKAGSNISKAMSFIKEFIGKVIAKVCAVVIAVLTHINDRHKLAYFVHVVALYGELQVEAELSVDHVV